MPWTVDDSAQRNAFNANKNVQVPPAAMARYFEWRRRIQQDGLHPKTAAERIGDMHFEQLSGKLKGTYTIRLSQEHRVAFHIASEQEVVQVFSVGGHYPPSKK